MNNKNSSSSSTSFNKVINEKSDTSNHNNHHFHYHLYQYQTNHCCFNLLDHSKSSSTVTTAASTHENYSNYHSNSAANSCPLGVTDVTLSLNDTAPRCHKDTEKTKTVTHDESILMTTTMSSESSNNNTNENATMLNSSGSEFPSTVYDMQQNKLNCPSITPSISYNGTAATSRMHTAEEKIIEIELSNEIFRKPQEERDNDDCSCTKKYLPYRINEKNVWQVYETSDCKYIHSKHEIDEVFQPPILNDSTLTSENCNLLHSRSNFSNQIICHEANHDQHHENVNTTEYNNIIIKNNTEISHKSMNSSSTINKSVNDNSSSFYTPTFNIKHINNSCQCTDETDNHQERLEKNSKVEDDHGNEEDDDESFIISNQSTSVSTREVFANGRKLLNRPKATNNISISRDQVKPVEKEIQNEIRQNDVKSSSRCHKNTFKTSSSTTSHKPKPIMLPSTIAKHQQQQRLSPSKRNNSYEDNSHSSNESLSNESQCESPEHSPNNSKEKSNADKENALMKQENKSVVIPNIHQGWSVTVG